MDEFSQISTELLPFICVENWFSCSISCSFWSIVFKQTSNMSEKEWFGIVDG